MDVADLVRRALEEDVGRGDVTSLATVAEGTRASAVVLAKQDLTVAGLGVARLVFLEASEGIAFQGLVAEGSSVPRGTNLASLEGPARGILKGERVALNFLQHLSGIATLTSSFVSRVKGTRAVVRDTRKTTPLLRSLEKEAVRLGGGEPHRPGLDAAILVKDNHIRLVGSVRETARRAAASGTPFEIEVETASQIEEALAFSPETILLDNFTPAEVERAVVLIAGRARIEVSGGVRLDTVRAYAEAGADYISVGALTHSAPAADISLELFP